VAYTLKSSGLATRALFVVAVDEDGTTVKEFVSSTVNSTMTLTGVTTGSASWKGTSRGYFVTSANGATNYFGPKFVTNFATVDGAAGFGIFMAYNQATAGDNNNVIIERTGNVSLLARDVSNKLDGLSDNVSTTSLPTDGSTKFSIGANHRQSVTSAYFYGLESGSLAADGSQVDPGFGGGTYDILGIGGAVSQGNAPGRVHICAGFDLCSLAEYQSLHDDWFNVLFDAPPAAPVLSAATVTAITATTATPRVTITF
jgi:hypothetical protein